MIDESPGGEPASEREVVVQRVFKAPASLLFEAYSKPEHLKRWYGPKGWPLTLCEMDFRPGGAYRFGMTGPDGQAMPPFGGRYLEIVPGRKVVSNCLNDDGQEIMVITVTFDERGDGTTLLEVHTLFDSIETKNRHVGMGYAQGVGSGLEQLEGLVTPWESA